MAEIQFLFGLHSLRWNVLYIGGLLSHIVSTTDGILSLHI